MSILAHKRSAMTLFSAPDHLDSHQVRIVLAEKGMYNAVELVDPEAFPEELVDLNPYRTLPTLVDRDFVLYDPQVIMEYLDERFPHPPLMPVYPIARANSRLMMYRIRKDWYGFYETSISPHTSVEEKESALQQLKANLTNINRVFQTFDYFMSEEFSLVDCYLAPLMWRLAALNCLPDHKALQPFHAYLRRLFSRKSFITSLTEAEKKLAT